MWQELLTALALMLVLEGLMPFLKPELLRRMVEMLAQMDDRSIRMAGLGSMLTGVVLLYVVR